MSRDHICEEYPKHALGNFVGVLLLTIAFNLSGFVGLAWSARDAGHPPSIEDYATVESIVDGVPVHSFGNIVYVYGQSPDMLPGVVMQEGNTNPARKIKLKKSWEIKHNYAGSEHEMTVRTAWNDSHPTLPIHLIDGDPDTVWSSWGCAVPDGRPEWIRIDLPIEAMVASIGLVCSKNFPVRYSPHGKALPKELEIRLSRDAWHWETVYESADFSGDASGATEIRFDPRPAKQIWIIANNFPENASWMGHIFSLGEVEVRNPAGANLALLSRGSGVTVSSTSYGLLNDRFTQDALWGPLQYDLGNKWVRVGPDNGSFTWNYVEIEKGKLQIDRRADESIDELNRNGVKVIMVLDWKGNWRYQDPPRKTNWREARFREFNDNYSDWPGSATDNPEMFAGYLRYVDYMVRHFKGRVAIYEVGNEWNGMTAEQYMKDIFEPTYAAIRKADPEARVMLGNLGGFDPDTMLECLGQPREVGLRNRKLSAQANTLVVVDDLTFKDAQVSVEARNEGQFGILLRYQDEDNYLAAFYAPHMNSIFFHERANGDWGQILDGQPVPDFGQNLRMVVRLEGSQAILTVSDGKKKATTRHLVQQLPEAGLVGLLQYTTGDQRFDNFAISDLQGKTLFKDVFDGVDGSLPAGWRYVSGGRQNPVPKGAGPRLDAIGWHPGDEPDMAYYKAVREFKKKAEALGFRGQYFATEIYASAGYPPGGTNAEMAMARYFARSLALHSALDMEAGPCHPHFTAFPHPQALCRQTWPVQTIVPTQPSLTYYSWRNMATAFDDFYANEFPVRFSISEELIAFTFSSGDKMQQMLAAWTPRNTDHVYTEVKTDAIFPGLRAAKAWVIDIFNGTEQELEISRSGNDTVVKGMRIKDYPVLIRLQMR